MNFVKKAILLSLTISLFSADVNCMQGFNSKEENRAAHKGIGGYEELGVARLKEKISKESINAWNVGDFLVQIASIYSIDSTNQTVVDALAKLRTLFNATSVLASAYQIWEAAGISKHTILHLFSGYFRGKNVIEEPNIWRNAASIASTNMGRKNDKKLNNKKLCQITWLMLNKILPILMTDHVGNYVILAEISELYRQKLVYKYIS